MQAQHAHGGRGLKPGTYRVLGESPAARHSHYLDKPFRGYR